MILIYILNALTLLLITMTIATLRISRWYQQESSYWNVVTFIIKDDPSKDDLFRPLLDWCEVEQPNLITRLKTWEEPPMRKLNKTLNNR